MTFDAVGWSGPDLGLDRTFDLSRSTLRTRTVRRRTFVLLVLVAGVGSILAVETVWPDAVQRPLFDLPYTATLVGLGLMGLAVVVMLVGAATMARAGSNPFDNHDPLRDLSGADRAWYAPGWRRAPLSRQPRNRSSRTPRCGWPARRALSRSTRV